MQVEERMDGMKKEIKIRQKRVLVWLLIAAMLWNNVSPVIVRAEDENSQSDASDIANIAEGTILFSGDKIICTTDNMYSLYYYDNDGTTYIQMEDWSSSSEDYSHTLISYSGSQLTTDIDEGSFVGWKLSYGYLSGALTSYNFTAVQLHTITYDGAEYENPNPAWYEEGTELELEDASRIGYTFEGWYSDADYNTKVESISTDETSGIYLYAKWKANTYNISYKNADETDIEVNEATNPSTYTYGVGVDSFGAVEKEGYTFEGWYDAATGGTKIESISATQTEDIILYARFTANSYPITYELYGGTNAGENPNSYSYGDGVASFGDATKPGHTFDGWYLDKEFTKPVTSISETETDEVTLYAKFTANKYKIKYELNGGTNSRSNPTEYICGAGVLDFAAASKDGYIFEGWYRDAAFTTKVESIDTTEMQDVILYAKFTATIYKITYELNGGTNARTNPAEYTYGVGVEKFADASRAGYTFEGWYSDEALTDSITTIDKAHTEAVTLYAKWSANSYAITYKLKGGSNSVDNPASYTVGAGVANFSDASKEGYTFNGWYNAAEGGTQITSISETQFGDITLYAQYTANTYAISYELDGGTNASSNPAAYTYGVGVSSLANAKKEGHTFDGWYTDADFSTKVKSISASQTGDITLYAKWTEIVIEPEEEEPEPDVPTEEAPTPETDVPTEETPTEETPTEETVVIEGSGTVSLKEGTAYVLGTGTWMVAGDDTIYAGGMTFYVAEDMECEFVKQ